MPINLPNTQEITTSLVTYTDVKTLNVYSSAAATDVHKSNSKATKMWTNAQCDGRRAEYRWRPLFNAAKFD